MRPRISITGSVRPSVRRSVGTSVRQSVGRWRFREKWRKSTFWALAEQWKSRLRTHHWLLGLVFLYTVWINIPNYFRAAGRVAFISKQCRFLHPHRLTWGLRCCRRLRFGLRRAGLLPRCYCVAHRRRRLAYLLRVAEQVMGDGVEGRVSSICEDI